MVVFTPAAWSLRTLSSRSSKVGARGESSRSTSGGPFDGRGNERPLECREAVHLQQKCGVALRDDKERDAARDHRRTSRATSRRSSGIGWQGSVVFEIEIGGQSVMRSRSRATSSGRLSYTSSTPPLGREKMASRA